MPQGPEFSITDKPVTEVDLPTSREDIADFQKTGHPTLVLLAEVALALAAAGIIVLTA